MEYAFVVATAIYEQTWVSGQLVTSQYVEEISSTAVDEVVERGTAMTSVAEGDTVVKLTGMRKVVAERMLASHTEIPPVTQNIKVDVTELMKFRKMLLAETGKKYSVNDLVLKAIAKCLTQHPEILVSFDEANHQIIQRKHVNIGMAVAL